MEILIDSKTEIKSIADATSSNVPNNGLKKHMSKEPENYPKQQILSNKTKQEKGKTKSDQSVKTDKKIENLPMIKIQTRIKQINNSLPPLFTESTKKIKNKANLIKTDIKYLSKIQEENVKSQSSIKRIYSSKFISKIGVNINKKSDPNIPTDNNTNIIISTPKSKTDDYLKMNTKIKIIPLKKETIIAKEKQFNNNKSCLNLKEWKRKNRIDDDVKIFNCFSGYPDMRRALLQRGWQENIDNDSVFFNFKCTLSTKNIEHDKVEKFQIINHYENSGEITRKGRLCHNLRNIKWFRDLSIDTFFPRCYDLSDVNDFDDFTLDFQITKAESILKDYFYDLRNIEENKLLICINIFERKLFDTDHDDIDKNQSECKVVSSIEWDAISEEDIIPLNEKETDEKKKVDTETKKNISRSKSSSERGVSKFNQNNNINNILSTFKPNANNPVKTKKNKIKYNDASINNPKYKDQVRKILDKLKETNFQYDMNGSRNVWIMKPSGLSRGRGIKCIDSLSDIFQQVKHGLNQFVVQKYIENSLIILNRKFDLRQWVLVSNLNPLTVWLYEEPYVRFGAEDFDLNNIKNLYSHLTNNSIGCKSNKFEKSSIPGNMWNIGCFKNYLSETCERDVYKEVLQPKIKDLIIYSLESVQDVIKNRKNTHEIFGYDLMVDTNFDVWLIEINSSPCMEYSTDITKQLVQLVMEDTLKVILDYPQNTNVDTGLWTLIHKSKFIETPQVPIGFNLLCEGVKLKPTNEI